MGKIMNSRTAERKQSSMTAEVRLSTLLVSLFVLFFFSPPVLSASSDGLQVLKISPQDRTAVIRGNDGKMKLVMKGDSLDTAKFSVRSSRFAGKDAKKHTLTVTEIAEGRVVLEEKQEEDSETIIIRLVNGKQDLERIRKRRPEERSLVKAAVTVQQKKPK